MYNLEIFPFGFMLPWYLLCIYFRNNFPKFSSQSVFLVFCSNLLWWFFSCIFLCFDFFVSLVLWMNSGHSIWAIFLGHFFILFWKQGLPKFWSYDPPASVFQHTEITWMDHNANYLVFLHMRPLQASRSSYRTPSNASRTCWLPCAVHLHSR